MTAETPVPIRPAATVILWRKGPRGPEVLMGQRGAGAVFMPDKVVFPGGAVDPADAGVVLGTPLPSPCAERLALDAPGGPEPAVLAAAGIRELWEETGLALGRPGAFAPPPDAGQDWAAFAARGLAPAADALRFVFRAVTPPGRPRRFDARFFLVPAAALAGDAADTSAASDELSHLAWLTLAEARRRDLPFITEVVLAEVALHLRGEAGAGGVPFFDNRGDRPVFRRLV
ncbi:MAG TPA: NUDIX domain-containing protein [Paracoccaceae bacterium]|nr:NUDIX domain-containing protein [Paracoccaceae bacterium]HMO70674.1 NUDIX domain-containing protein [Paracoccaceae bacterium]